MGITSFALVLASTAISAYSAVATASAQEDSARFNQAVAKNDAIAAQEQSQYEADRIRDRNRRVMASQRSAMLRNGGLLTGSNDDVMFDTAVQGELDVAAEIYKGNVATGAAKSRAQLYGMQASSAGTAGLLGMGSSILGGALQATQLVSNPNFKWRGK